jgi:hypothetical protein
VQLLGRSFVVDVTVVMVLDFTFPAADKFSEYAKNKRKHTTVVIILTAIKA